MAGLVDGYSCTGVLNIIASTAKKAATTGGESKSGYRPYGISISASHTISTSGAYTGSSYVRPYSRACRFIIKY